MISALLQAPPGCLQGVHILGWVPRRVPKRGWPKLGKVEEAVTRALLHHWGAMHRTLAKRLQVSIVDASARILTSHPVCWRTRALWHTLERAWSSHTSVSVLSERS